MGRFEIQSETVFDYKREVVWDFATNPNNWVSVFVPSIPMDPLCMTSDKRIERKKKVR